MPEIESSASTSSSLIRRASKLDADAWHRLSQLYGPLVYRWCRQAGLQDSDAADLVQEAFQSVAYSIAQFDADRGTNFRGWLWGITRHKLHDHFRRSQHLPQATGGSDAHRQFEQLPEKPWEDSVETAGFDVQGSLARRALAVIQADFTEQTWKAFWRVTIDGLAPADVATEMEMSVVAVYKAKSRVLAHLRTELAGLLD